MIMPREMRLLALLFLSAMSSLLLLPREMPDTPISLFWLLSRLDLLCSWFIWPASLLKALALTLLEV
uniref:Uncharacterized protein n=1 Tax=Solanum lycopersicum TaxID=4081 RepID=A0A3Q7F9Y4_SOLLC